MGLTYFQVLQCRLYHLGMLIKFLVDMILGKHSMKWMTESRFQMFLKCHSNSDIGKLSLVTYSNPAILLSPGRRKTIEKHVPTRAVSTHQHGCGATCTGRVCIL